MFNLLLSPHQLDCSSPQLHVIALQLAASVPRGTPTALCTVPLPSDCSMPDVAAGSDGKHMGRQAGVVPWGQQGQGATPRLLEPPIPCSSVPARAWQLSPRPQLLQR